MAALLEAGTLASAKQLIGRYTHIVEEYLPQISRTTMHRLDGLAARNARKRHIHDEHAELLRLAFKARSREHDAQIEMRRIGDPDFRAVQNVAVAVAHRMRAHASDVASRMGFAEGALDHDIAPGIFRQPVAFLFLGAGAQDQIGGAVGVDALESRGALRIAVLLVADEMVQDVAAAAAIFFGHAGAEDSGVRGLAEQVSIVDSRSLPFGDIRLDFLLVEPAYRLAERVVLFLENASIVVIALRPAHDVSGLRLERN